MATEGRVAVQAGETGIFLVTAYLTGVTYVRCNLFKPLRQRSGLARYNLNLHALDFVSTLAGVAGSFILLNFDCWRRACLLVLAAVLYDVTLRTVFFHREVLRLRRREPSLTRDRAYQRVRKRARVMVCR
jgi:hypothetical protein